MVARKEGRGGGRRREWRYGKLGLDRRAWGPAGAYTATRRVWCNDARCTNYDPGGGWMNLYVGISVSLWEIADSFLGVANNNF